MYDLDQLIRDRVFLPGLRLSLEHGTPPPLLRDAKIKITSRCNLHCQMCSYWRNRSEESLPGSRWQRVLDELAALGCRKVHFSGGEVFMRPDFPELVEHAVATGLKTNLTTNATLIDKQRARRLVRARVNSVSISLDGPTAELHDRLRGVAGAFKRTVRAIRRLQELSAGAQRKVKVRINFVLMRSNFRTLPEMVQLAADLGAVDLCAMPVDEKGRGTRRLSRSQIELFNREVAPRVHELRSRHGFPTGSEAIYPFGVTPKEISYTKQGLYARGLYERTCCLAPWLHTFVAWNGDVYLCCMTNGRMAPLGNVTAQPLAEIFHGSGYADVRAAFSQRRHLTTCSRCDLFLTENRTLHAALAARRNTGP